VSVDGAAIILDLSARKGSISRPPSPNSIAVGYGVRAKTDVDLVREMKHSSSTEHRICVTQTKSTHLTERTTTAGSR
jgi:hypothetical protein